MIQKNIVKFLITSIFILLITPAYANKSLITVEALNNQDKEKLIKEKLYSNGCPVELNRLRKLSFPFYNFSGKVENGEIIVLDAVANNVKAILLNLYKSKFPLNMANAFVPNDVASMKLNNTYSFSCRPIAGSKVMSIHAFGAAIDINPEQNPVIYQDTNPGKYETKNVVQPLLGQKYLNRTNIRAGMIENLQQSLFYNNGFTIWGGRWNDPIDWQHIQIPRALAETLVLMQSKDAIYLFKLYAKSKALKDNFTQFNQQIIINYKLNNNKFISYLKANEGTFVNNPQTVLSKYKS